MHSTLQDVILLTELALKVKCNIVIIIYKYKFVTNGKMSVVRNIEKYKFIFIE